MHSKYGRRLKLTAKAEYAVKKNKARRAIGKAKHDAWTEWYEELNHPEEAKKIYRIAKQGAESQKDTMEVTVIKNSNDVILTEGDKIKARWKEYFGELLNVENDRDVPTEGPIENITTEEIRNAVKMMKKGKAPGLQRYRVRFWRPYWNLAKIF